MKVYGALSMTDDVMPEDLEIYESRYLGVSANANEDTCADQGDLLFPLPGAEFYAKLDDDGQAMGGHAIYNHDGGTEACLFHDVIGKSVSLFEDETMSGQVDACCTIVEIDKATFDAEYAAFKQARQEAGIESDDEESEESEEEEQAPAEEPEEEKKGK